MKIALYGLPCAGKSTLLSTLKNIRVVNGSTVLDKMSEGKFKTLSESEQERYRIKYIEYLRSLQDKVVISDGHYSFLENVVFTEQDALAYDVFIYLYCSPATLYSRYTSSEKNGKYSELTENRIQTWQTFEMECIREECHKNNKDFYVINGETITPENFYEFVEAIKNGYSSYMLAVNIVDTIKTIFPQAGDVHIVDGDKTLIMQDSFRVCSNGYKTKVFDGDFYTGYQSMQFAEETKKVNYDFTQIDSITLNPQVYKKIKEKNYFVLSSGISVLWEMLSKKHNLTNIIADPFISADTKYFVVKQLKATGYNVIAYGDSKNDLYMLQAADEGYLCIAERISRSLHNANTQGLKLLYNKQHVIFTDYYSDDVENDIAICKSNSGINGNRLAQAHLNLGKKIGQKLVEIIPHHNTAVLVLERGGRFFGDGLYLAFGGKLYPVNPSKEQLPNILESIVVIVDSVINTGKSLLKIISQLQEANPNIEIVIAANVIQEKALHLFDNYKLFAIRTSANSFKGQNQATQIGNTGPDTAERLFNLIK